MISPLRRRRPAKVSSAPASPTVDLNPESVVAALFDSLLGRAPGDQMAAYVQLLETAGVAGVTRHLIGSDEFRARAPDAYAVKLPDLSTLMPERYRRGGGDSLIYEARDAEGLRLMERMIVEHRYYDSFVAWHPIIDLDKRVTAAVVRCLGAQSVLELGCFAGSVLKLLDDAGVAVTGVEISHRAFLVAHPSIYHRIRFGDLLTLDLPPEGFDAFLAMDILEHLNPLDLDAYVARIAQLIGPQGFAYVNSPMFGEDDVFGQVFQQYLPAWREAGPDVFWTQLHCDAQGWPAHGHLVWAAPQWWEALFARHGLVRDREAERLIQARLAEFFAVRAPARKSLFVLRPVGAEPLALDQVEARMRDILDPLLVDPTAP